MSLQAQLDKLFSKIEDAIDSHPRLVRLTGSKGSVMGEPKLSLTRFGATVEIPVKLKGSRRKETVISGYGDTPEEAVEYMIAQLDHWADVM